MGWCNKFCFPSEPWILVDDPAEENHQSFSQYYFRMLEFGGLRRWASFPVDELRTDIKARKSFRMIWNKKSNLVNRFHRPLWNCNCLQHCKILLLSFLEKLNLWSLAHILSNISKCNKKMFIRAKCQHFLQCESLIYLFHQLICYARFKSRYIVL